MDTRWSCKDTHLLQVPYLSSQIIQLRLQRLFHFSIPPTSDQFLAELLNGALHGFDLLLSVASVPLNLFPPRLQNLELLLLHLEVAVRLFLLGAGFG